MDKALVSREDLSVVLEHAEDVARQAPALAALADCCKRLRTALAPPQVDVDDEVIIREAKREALEEVRGRIGVYTTREAIVSILAASIAALDPKCEHKNTALIYDNGAPIGHYRCLNPECQAVALAVPGEWQEAAK